ncbi:hypothetical protein JCM8208_002810 [Rhodotorula glutinis]
MDHPQHSTSHALDPATLAAAIPLPPTPPPPPPPRAAATQRALSLDHVVHRILAHLKLIHLDGDHPHHPAHAANSDLVACALVGPLWRVSAQELLNEHLVFNNGIQVRKWLDGLGDDGTPRSSTRTLALCDDLPFKPSSRDGDGAKWSYADMALLLAKVKNVEHLEIHFVRQDEIPGDLLTHENLATVQILSLGCPVSKPTKPLPFSLNVVQLVDPHGDDARLKRDWTSTAILLGTSPALANVRYLRLEEFPRAADCLVRMFRLAPRISALFLSVLHAEHNLWQVELFARLCTRLASVYVEHLLDTGAKVLGWFPTGPPSIIIGNVHGVVGYNHPFILPALVPPCPIDELLNTLWRHQSTGVRRVLFHHLTYGTYDYEAAFHQPEELRGIRFRADVVRTMTKDDRTFLAHLIRESQADRRWQEQHPRQAVDEVA